MRRDVVCPCFFFAAQKKTLKLRVLFGLVFGSAAFRRARAPMSHFSAADLSTKAQTGESELAPQTTR
jgi:hypothetical protein